MPRPEPRYDLTRTTFTLLAIGLLLTATFWVLYPFLPALIWAATIVIASWPMMVAVQKRLWRSRALAVTVMTATMLLVLILPLSIALSTVISNVGELSQFVRSLITQGIPQPPDWLTDLPLIGPKLARHWQEVAAYRSEEIVERAAPYAGKFFGWFITQVGGFGMVFIHFLLTVIISAILYAKGEVAARGFLRFARRLADDQGEQALRLAAQAIRAVALGVVVTALIQSLMSAAGFMLAGVPYAAILTSVIFLLAVVQIGSAPVLILVTIWLFRNSGAFTAWAFLIWAVLIMLADNFIRPLLIKAGANLPLLLIFAGVIGGLISFGVIGLFIGPVVLAVSYTLLKAWVAGGRQA